MKRYLVWLLIAVAPLMAVRAEPPKPRPIEIFAALPFMVDPELSPKGDKLVAKVSIGGTQYLAIISLFDKGARPRIVRIGEGDLNWYRWVNDEWLVVGIGAVQNVQGSEWYLRRALGVSVDPDKKIVPLLFNKAAQSADDVLWVANDGTPRILLAVQQSIYLGEDFWPTVFEVDVSTGKMKKVVKPVTNVMSWYADGSGAVRMGIGYNDSRRSSRLLYRENSRGLFRTVDRADGRKDEELTTPALFLSDPGQAIAFDNQDGFNALYELDLNTLKLGKRIFGVPGHDVDGIIADHTRSKLLGVRYTTTHARTHWFDPELAEIQESLDKAVPGRWAQIISSNRDRSRLLVRVAAANSPGAYYYFAPSEGVMHPFAYISEALKLQPLGPVRTVRYKARDGLEMSAVLTLPPGREAKNLPLIVLAHGGPSARDEEGGFDWWWSQFLADRGYAVIQPNYRGSTGFGEEFADRGLGQWGLGMQDDLNDAVAYLAKEGIADPKRVCMTGASYGGYSAMRAAQRDGALYRCAISYAGVSDLGALARYDRRSLYGGSANDWLRENAPDFDSVSPINFPSEFSIPILVVHGKKDLRVPIRQSRELVEKLRTAGKAVEYIEQPLGDHHFSREADRLQFLSATEAFLRKYNPAN